MNLIDALTRIFVTAFQSFASDTPWTSGSPETRVLRFYSRKPRVRPSLVKDIARGHRRIPDDISPVELVAACSILVAGQPFDEACQTAIRWSNEEGASRFDTEFFLTLQQMAREFSTKDLDQQAMDLLRLGEVIARTYHIGDWEFQLYKQIDQKIVGEIRSKPVIRYRV